MQTITILLLGLAGFVVFFTEARGDRAIRLLVILILGLCGMAVVAEIALATPATCPVPMLQPEAP